jgi:A/G-specific adenine glycosylase
MNVSELIIPWYKKNRRYLPWREDKNPYSIWLSEIILQQTRVGQGTPYYHRFMESFPDVNKLADASVEEVLLVWQGLGYYSRARNLHKAAGIIARDFKGKFPSDYEHIRSLPGVGDYTAAAIASLAFDMPYAAVDGNVYRVLSRYLGIDTPINSPAGKKLFLGVATKLLDRNNPGTHNQAMIELGALVCTPKNPGCGICPLNGSCIALEKSVTVMLPVKTRKVQTRIRYFYYFILYYKGRIYIRQRKGKDIWALLYEFPLIESDREIELDQLPGTAEWQIMFNTLVPEVKSISVWYKHILSHQIIHARFIEVKLISSPCLPDAVCLTPDELENYPLPRLITVFLEKRGTI